VTAANAVSYVYLRLTMLRLAFVTAVLYLVVAVAKAVFKGLMALAKAVVAVVTANVAILIYSSIAALSTLSSSTILSVCAFFSELRVFKRGVTTS